MTEADMRAELTRICALKNIKPGVKEFLEWMGEQALTSANFRINSHQVHKKFFPDRTYDEDRQSSRNLVRDARLFLKLAYQKLNSTGIWITIPDKLPSDPTHKGAYTLRFEEGARQTPYIAPVSATKLGPAAAFWKRLIAPINPVKGILIYPAEQPELGEKADDRGLYSGSGEVAAAFLIGMKTANLNTLVETRRSNYVSQDELAVGNSWLVFLGSSLSNYALRDVLEEARWADLRLFHFESTPSGGLVSKRKPAEKAEKTYGYTVFVERKREEDHALISYFRDVENSQVLIAFGGISTVGTWAAARFLCDDTSIQVLQDHLGIHTEGDVPSFEVLLKVSVSGYRPTKAKIIDFSLHYGGSK